MLRFAPSPTGDMHIGNLRVAVFNHLVAKQKNERLLIRIEDTDKERNIEGKDREILDILGLFGIEYENVVYQSANEHIHQQLAKKLLDEKKAFACFCSEEEIDIQREKAKKEKKPYRYSGKCENLTSDEIRAFLEKKVPFTTRLKKPEKNIKFTDLIKGEFDFSPFDIDSFIIMRAGFSPTYNFACSVDDMLYDISLVIRGEDHLSNTPKQIAIRDALGYDKEIKYAHLPIILNEEGKKMSKRDNASSVKWLLEEGFLPEAIANYLILLGNSFENEIFTLNEAVEFFDITKISRSPARFDLDKLRFINKEHMKKIEKLTHYIAYHEEYEPLARLYLDEVSTIKELKEKLDFVFFKHEFDEFGEEIEILKNEILNNPLEEEYNDFKQRIIDNTGLKGKKLFMPLRMLFAGSKQGPEIKDLYNVMRTYIKMIIKEYR
jgi:glutamyl-tRNA synthetase